MDHRGRWCPASRHARACVGDGGSREASLG
jgi:hypothetical protein